MISALLLMVSVVLFNHMGLSAAIEGLIGYKFRILSCSKCCTFWLSLIALLVGGTPIVLSVTLSFVLSYAALWLDLLLAIMARSYESTYDKVSEAPSDHSAASS